jgi:hypothetical protein
LQLSVAVSGLFAAPLPLIGSEGNKVVSWRQDFLMVPAAQDNFSCAEKY